MTGGDGRRAPRGVGGGSGGGSGRAFGSGTHTVAYRSIDNLFHVEPTRTCSVYIDNVPPETTDKAEGTPYPGDVAFWLGAKDAHSGVAATRWYWSNPTSGYTSQEWQDGEFVQIPALEGKNAGTIDVWYYSLDTVGNWESMHHIQVEILGKEGVSATLKVLPSRKR